MSNYPVVSVEDPECCAVFNEVDGRIFYDLEAMFLQFSQMVLARNAEASTDVEHAAVYGAGVIVESIRQSYLTLEAEFQMSNVDNVGDIKFGD